MSPRSCVTEGGLQRGGPWWILKVRHPPTSSSWGWYYPYGRAKETAREFQKQDVDFHTASDRSLLRLTSTTRITFSTCTSQPLLCPTITNTGKHTQPDSEHFSNVKTTHAAVPEFSRCDTSLSRRTVFEHNASSLIGDETQTDNASASRKTHA